jgi:hypothetical protein
VFEKTMRHAMALVLVMVQTFKQEHRAATNATLPVLVVNDSDGASYFPRSVAFTYTHYADCV